MFALRRNKDGKLVAKAGLKNSYTTYGSRNVQTYPTIEEAERNRCRESETIIPYNE